MINLERIDPGDWEAVDRLREQLQSLIPDTGGLSLGLRGGSVDGAGVITAGTGFTVTKNGTGDYTIDTRFERVPVVIVGTGETAATYAAKLHPSTPPSTTGFRVFCHAAGTPVDGAFHWAVMI